MAAGTLLIGCPLQVGHGPDACGKPGASPHDIRYAPGPLDRNPTPAPSDVRM